MKVESFEVESLELDNLNDFEIIWFRTIRRFRLIVNKQIK